MNVSAVFIGWAFFAYRNRARMASGAFSAGGCGSMVGVNSVSRRPRGRGQRVSVATRVFEAQGICTGVYAVPDSATKSGTANYRLARLRNRLLKCQMDVLKLQPERYPKLELVRPCRVGAVPPRFARGLGALLLEFVPG